MVHGKGTGKPLTVGHMKKIRSAMLYLRKIWANYLVKEISDDKARTKEFDRLKALPNLTAIDKYIDYKEEHPDQSDEDSQEMNPKEPDNSVNSNKDSTYSKAAFLTTQQILEQVMESMVSKLANVNQKTYDSIMLSHDIMVSNLKLIPDICYECKQIKAGLEEIKLKTKNSNEIQDSLEKKMGLLESKLDSLTTMIYDKRLVQGLSSSSGSLQSKDSFQSGSNDGDNVEASSSELEMGSSKKRPKNKKSKVCVKKARKEHAPKSL